MFAIINYTALPRITGYFGGSDDAEEAKARRKSINFDMFFIQFGADNPF